MLPSLLFNSNDGRFLSSREDSWIKLNYLPICLVDVLIAVLSNLFHVMILPKLMMFLPF